MGISSFLTRVVRGAAGFGKANDGNVAVILALATLTFIAAGLLGMTRWPRRLVGTLVLLAGAGLLADIGGWWLSRESGALVGAMVVAGAVYNGAVALMMVMVIVDALRPGRRM